MSRNKSDTNKEARYIKVPLPMFRLLIKDKRKISDVIAYGVYLTAMAQKVSIVNAALQLIYVIRNPQNSNRRVEIPTWLKVCLTSLQSELGMADEEPELNNGFIKESTDWVRYCPHTPDDEDAQEIVLDYCRNNKFFADNVVEFHALRQAAEWFDFEYMKIDDMIKVHNKYKNLDNELFAYANIQIMLDYLKDINNKTEDDMACLLMYMSYKSIIGDKDVAKATTELVTARMVGARGRDELKSILAKHDHAKQFFDRYSKREVFERIRGMVGKYKFIPRIQTIPGKPGLGTFVSCDRNMSDKKLAEKIKAIVDDERKRKNREYVANHRAKYKLESCSNKYLAEMFGTSSDTKKAKLSSEESEEQTSDLPF